MDGTDSAGPCEQAPSYSHSFSDGIPPVILRCVYQPSGGTVFLSSDGESKLREMEDGRQKRFLGYFLTDEDLVKVPGVGFYDGRIAWCGENSVPSVACDQRLYVRKGSRVTEQQLRRLLGKDEDVLDNYELAAGGFMRKPLEVAAEESGPPAISSTESEEAA